MGVQITDLLSGREVSLEVLKNKTFAVDTYNLLYQFLSSIRQADGSLLTDSKGRVTSHLSGLFSKITRLMQYNMRFAFCFDGKIPVLKKNELHRRKELKLEAATKYEAAAEKEDLADMRKFASRTAKLTPEMADEAKKLILALGQCIVEAPSEGEAQASFIVKNGDADFVLSQDTDCLLFGAPRVVRNLTVSGRRKVPGSLASIEIQPAVISLKDTLERLGLDNDGLIVLSMLVGTDYNVGGVKGLGPKKSLAIVKKHGNDFNAVFEEVKWSDCFIYSWKEVFDTIKHMPVTNDYSLKWGVVDKEKVLELLVREHDFSKERVLSSLNKLDESSERKQKGLLDFF